tara:strand:- start:628 stop:792 length:165 start_codon:yes stop_codon:yes gene_type:complete
MIVVLFFSAFIGGILYLIFEDADTAKFVAVAFFFLIFIFITVFNISKVHGGKFQ